MYTTIIIAVVALALGVGIGWTMLRLIMKHRAQNIIKEAEAEAEVLKKDKMLQAKEKFLQMKTEHEKQVAARNSKIQQAENKLKQQETEISRKLEDIQRKTKDIQNQQGNIDVQKELLEKKTAELDKLKKQYRLMRNVELMNKLKAEVTTPDSLNDAFVDKYKNSNETLFELNGKAYPLSLAIKENLKQRGRMADEVAYSTLEGLATQAETNAVIELEKQMLEENDPDFKNLMNEYRDGMLLFEISNRKVWDKAATDTAGLRAYFEANRAKYKWDSPKYKGYLIQTTGDSVTRLVKERISQLEPDSMVMKLRKEFSKDMRITKVLVAKGENPRVDSEVFGAEKVKPTDKYTDYFVYGGKLLAKPEEVSDVRGPVVSDYQNQLETEWVEWLRKEYPVEVDEKVLKSVK